MTPGANATTIASKLKKNVTKKAITDKSKVVTVYHGTNLKTKSTDTPFKIRGKFNIPDKKTIVGHIAEHCAN